MGAPKKGAPAKKATEEPDADDAAGDEPAPESGTSLSEAEAPGPDEYLATMADMLNIPEADRPDFEDALQGWHRAIHRETDKPSKE